MTESLDGILAALRQKYAPPSSDPSSTDNTAPPAIPRDPLPAKESLTFTKDLQGRSPETPHPDLQRWAAQHQEQRRNQLRNQAQQWLDHLDPLSGEGLWFADFAKHYPSPLEAAIALLQTEGLSPSP